MPAFRLQGQDLQEAHVCLQTYSHSVPGMLNTTTSSPHKVTQYKKGKDSLSAQGKRRYDRKQTGYGGQKKPVFHKKAKTTKKVVLRLECTVCKYKMQLPIKRCKQYVLSYLSLSLHCHSLCHVNAASSSVETRRRRVLRSLSYVASLSFLQSHC